MKKVGSLFVGFLVVALIVGAADKCFGVPFPGGFGQINMLGTKCSAVVSYFLKGFPGGFSPFN